MKLNKYILLAIWVGMFILCAVLGYLPPQEGANKWLLVIMAVLFFLPPALTVYQCQKEKDGKLLRLVRTVALVVLILAILGASVYGISKRPAQLPKVEYYNWIADEAGLVNGYRVITNIGADGCQSVKHLHFHILGGKQLPDQMA